MGIAVQTGCEVHIVEVGLAEELAERPRTDFLDELPVAFLMGFQLRDDAQVILAQRRLEQPQVALALLG